MLLNIKQFLDGLYSYRYQLIQEGEFENDARSEGNLSDKEVVKSEEAPYIVQEKDILSNIRVVDEVKRKFSGQC